MASCQDDDIDALLSAAGTFVHEQKHSASSIIGPHSAVCTTPQLMPENVDTSSHGQELSVNVANDAAVSTIATTYAESSPHNRANNNDSKNKPVHHSTGEIHAVVTGCCFEACYLDTLGIEYVTEISSSHNVSLVDELL